MYKRVLVKISGEALSCESGKGIDFDMLDRVAEEIKDVVKEGIGISIVIGGGNFWRGKEGDLLRKTTSDYMGMLATAINAMALQDMLERKNIATRIQTSLHIEKISEEYNINKTNEMIDKSYVPIFACGSGSPFFTTDTAAVLKAIETDADIVLLAKNVDAIYDKDPSKYSDAKKYKNITFKEILEKNIKAIDKTAASLCMDNNVNVVLFGIKEKGNILKAVLGEKIGTKITNN